MKTGCNYFVMFVIRFFPFSFPQLLPIFFKKSFLDFNGTTKNPNLFHVRTINVYVIDYPITNRNFFFQEKKILRLWLSSKFALMKTETEISKTLHWSCHRSWYRRFIFVESVFARIWSQKKSYQLFSEKN